MNTITTEWLSLQMGIPMNAVRLAVQPAKPDKSGNYESDAVEFAFAWLRRQREFMERIEIGQLLEVEGGTVSDMVERGILEQDEMGRYPRQSNIQKIVKWFQERLGDGKSIASQQKIQERALDIKKKEAELARITGEWIPLDVVKKAWENNVLLARGILLRLANKIAPRIAYMRSEQEAHACIQAEIEQTLTELSRTPEYGESNQNPEAV